MKGLDMYTLVGRIAVPCLNPVAWTKWRMSSKGKRHVAKDILRGCVDGEEFEIEISTVFLGLDHGYGVGDPLLFETLVFGGPRHMSGDRYSTWEEAEAGHAAFVAQERLWLAPQSNVGA